MNALVKVHSGEAMMNIEKFIGYDENVPFGRVYYLCFTNGDNSPRPASKLVTLDEGDLSWRRFLFIFFVLPES